MAYKHDDKSSGQLIRSADWNLMGHEIERLETDKVNRTGDIIKGDLRVTGKVQLDSLAVTGDASITGKVQFGPLTVSGDASVSGKAQLGSLAVTGDASISGKAQLGSLAVTGNTSITSGVLQVGSLQLSGFTDADQDQWPNVVWYRDIGKNWDEGLIKHSSARGKFGRAGFGVHFHQAREFGLWSTGWDPLFAVEGGTGNAYFKGNLAINSKLDVNGQIWSHSDGFKFPDNTIQITAVRIAAGTRDFGTQTGVKTQSADISISGFQSVPTVIVSLSRIDSEHAANLRINVTVTNVSASKFTINVETWADTKIYSSGVSWIAIGQ